MKKIILMLVIALFLIGCTSKENTTSTTDPFLGGSEGLSISFVEGAPPSEVFDNNNFNFDIELELENKGEADIPSDKVIVKIDGINSEEFGVNSLVQNGEEDIQGSEKDSSGKRVDGDTRYVLFRDLSYQKKVVGAALTRPLLASVCYNYETKAIANVCILKDSAKDDSSVCTVNANKNVQSSSGPVQVNSFVEKNAGTNKIEFQFVVQSTANIFETDSECGTDRTSEDVVEVSVESGISGLSCSGLRDGSDTEGKITLRDGSYTVRCVQELNSDNDFETSVEVSLKYAVKDSVKKEITIKPSN